MIFSSNAFRAGLATIFRAPAAKPVLVNVRYMYEAFHNPKSRIFFVPLDNNTKQAVLYYRINGKVMDIRSVTVPEQYKGKGIAKLLTETAFTYAIVNDFHLFLTCSYAQRYFLENKNQVLEQKVLGPEEIVK